MVSGSKVVCEWYVAGMSSKVLVSRRGCHRRLLKMPSSLEASFPLSVPNTSLKKVPRHLTGYSHLSESGTGTRDEQDEAKMNTAVTTGTKCHRNKRDTDTARCFPMIRFGLWDTLTVIDHVVPRYRLHALGRND